MIACCSERNLLYFAASPCESFERLSGNAKCEFLRARARAVTRRLLFICERCREDVAWLKYFNVSVDLDISRTREADAATIRAAMAPWGGSLGSSMTPSSASTAAAVGREPARPSDSRDFLAMPSGDPDRQAQLDSSHSRRSDESISVAHSSAPAVAQDEEDEQFRASLDTFFHEFHRHIFNPVLLRLAALEIREDLSGVRKDPP
ncbi:unnamed protein product [Polarella glacialis]|uniref:Uncharacterized protein n=1 Tax=Polarella glacialis TaxID=89957 RepID=A0A813FT76_POLGL|nr:unnamed protein product [Polarella glacialis]